MPSSISGSDSVQVVGLRQALGDDLSWQWNLSIIPLAIGLYEVVQMREQPNSCIRCRQSLDSNCHPISVVTDDGTPNLEIQPLIKAQTTVSAVASGMGMASGH